jgi:hypothetical protein
LGGGDECEDICKEAGNQKNMVGDAIGFPNILLLARALYAKITPAYGATVNTNGLDAATVQTTRIIQMSRVVARALAEESDVLVDFSPAREF